MKLVLKQEVDKLGLAGDVVDVADGYGRNYLIPAGLAMRATRGALKEAETLSRARKARESETRDAAEEYREAIEARVLRIPARVDELGHLYGSVGAADVQQVLKDRGHDVETKRIDTGDSIKEIGDYVAHVRLHPQVTAEVAFEVVDIEGEVTPETAEEAEELGTFEERALAAAAEMEAEEIYDLDESEGETEGAAEADSTETSEQTG